MSYEDKIEKIAEALYKNRFPDSMSFRERRLRYPSFAQVYIDNAMVALDAIEIPEKTRVN